MAQPQSQTRALKPPYSVLIIGAGINGCGLFRDLCLQGVDCLLIDRGDICGGASAAPSRLIHGGIKYLETGELRLVRESAMERNRLLRNAPHYVKPLQTILPVRSRFGGIASSILRLAGINTKLRDRGAVITRLGLRIYDVYNRKVRALPDHSFLGQAKVRSEYPAFAPGVKAAGLYYEGQITHAERLGLELVLDGLDANSASALRTYTTATHSQTSGDIILTDDITGKTSEVSCDVVANAAGAWIDKVNAGLGLSTSYIGGSKGSHLIVNHPQLFETLKGRMIYFGTADGRVNLICPLFGNVLIGATDIPVVDADEAQCSEEEKDYLVSSVSEIFPEIRISQQHIRLTYCGVRPLPSRNGGDIGAVSRDHTIAHDVLPGTKVPVLSLIGGKWTTFRAFAAQAADSILGHLGRNRRLATEDLPIGGGRNYPADHESAALYAHMIAGHSRLPYARAQQLFERYGTKASAVAQALAHGKDTSLVSLPSFSAGEVAYICKTEHVRRLSDILLRRTSIAMEGRLTIDVAAEVAAVVAEALSWSTARTSKEMLLMQAEFKRRSINTIAEASAAAWASTRT